MTSRSPHLEERSDAILAWLLDDPDAVDQSSHLRECDECASEAYALLDQLPRLAAATGLSAPDIAALEVRLLRAFDAPEVVDLATRRRRSPLVSALVPLLSAAAAAAIFVLIPPSDPVEPGTKDVAVDRAVRAEATVIDGDLREDDVMAGLDEQLRELNRCAPRAGAEQVDITVRVGRDGRTASTRTSSEGPVAMCVERVLQRTTLGFPMDQATVRLRFYFHAEEN
jgi:hypothetical protein